MTKNRGDFGYTQIKALQNLIYFSSCQGVKVAVYVLSSDYLLPLLRHIDMTKNKVYFGYTQIQPLQNPSY